METPSDQAVVLFPNTQSAIRAEHLLQAEGIAGRLIPVPRQFSAECGLAFRFPVPDSARVQDVLDRSGLRYQAIHTL